MKGHRSHVAAAAVVTACGLAIVAAYALAQADKDQQGTAAAITVPAAVIIFAVLVWLRRQR